MSKIALKPAVASSVVFCIVVVLKAVSLTTNQPQASTWSNDVRFVFL